MTTLGFLLLSAYSLSVSAENFFFFRNISRGTIAFLGLCRLRRKFYTFTLRLCAKVRMHVSDSKRRPFRGLEQYYYSEATLKYALRFAKDVQSTDCGTESTYFEPPGAAFQP